MFELFEYYPCAVVFNKLLSFDEPIIIVQILTQLGCNLGLNLGIFYESGEEGANFDVKTQNKFFFTSEANQAKKYMYFEMSKF